MVTLDYASAVSYPLPEHGLAWVSYEACARAALLGLISSGWDGHEIFNIVAPQICFAGDALDPEKGPGTLELLEKHWKRRVTNVDRAWFQNDPRRSTWDSSRAERLLGWRHD